MSNKQNRSDIARCHTEDMDRLFSEEIKKSITGTKIYGVDFCRKEETGHSPDFILEQSYTEESVIKTAGNGKLAVLNFASYRHAGGGFLKGAMAQEEAICHSSFLYNILREFPDYYGWNESNYNRGLYTNRALYSPEVYFFSDNYEKYVKADVITCAAPNRSVMRKDGRFSEEENELALKERIQFIRDICDEECVDTFITGAFGCGVFAQKPEVVANLFMDLFGDTKVKKVIFAIPPDRNYVAFEKEYNNRFL